MKVFLLIAIVLAAFAAGCISQTTDYTQEPSSDFDQAESSINEIEGAGDVTEDPDLDAFVY
ncbi:MAG: hypothetical protein HYW25_05445 [Candidatus Aenigmarchaeota archaeon]|nr:hypothetical protein [Candidatus Aenigmarchaeota archaeon]